ncbi:flagellar hook-basal body protein [Thermodesulfitimonas autotrophica]|uniref:flagellar hook-basal body protein n=1 Tax=Thermodesulfitimonas autotrophica TaxID=1894989 RepID=UPI002FE1775D
MLRGIYIAATGLNLQQVAIDLVANNMANVSTTGFKSDRLSAASFPELLLLRVEPERKVQPVGSTSYGAEVAAVTTDYTQGPLENTGNLRDVALRGEGFLVVQTGAGERYFRGGPIFVDGEGYLVTANGDWVLGEGGPVQVGSSDYRIAPDGTVLAGENPVDRLLVVDFQDKGALIKEGNGYFRAAGSLPETATGTEVLQGYLEAANVDLTREMTVLIEGLRAYQLSQRALRTHDELLAKAVNQVGKVR